MGEILCRTCGATTGIRDGYRVCNQAGRRHPSVRVAAGEGGRLTGSGGWALGLGLGTWLLAAVLLVGLEAACREEPLLRALLLGLTGLALGFAPLFGWRMWRPTTAAWKRPLALGLLALASGLAAGLTGFWLRTRPETPIWAIAPIVPGWLAGHWAGVLPRAVVTEHSGMRLAKALKEMLARTRDRVACQVEACSHQGMACPAERCSRRMCGTHWISQEGRCPTCGTRLVTRGRPAMRLDWTPWLTGLGVTIGLAIALTLGGPGGG